MNKIFKNLTLQEVFREVLPSFGISLMIAEYFYKLGSFALESTAFLVTWYFMGSVINKIRVIKNNKK